MDDMSDQPRQPEDQSDETDEQQSREVHATATIDDDRVVVVTPEGMGVAERPEDGKPTQNPADLVEQPAKVMRIGSMIKQLLEEVRNAPLDDAGRARLADVHERSLAELKDGLAPELVEELERISLPFSEDAPSDAELRIAQAQLVGWLEGLFHGIQTALVAQQMAAQAQLQQMRQLPPGHAPAPGPMGNPMGMPNMPSGPASGPDSGPGEGTGQYL
ncbi:bacterial proteasome activator family protein [Knoellia sp. CPCC 206453]|uniref:bacterial proteasome activator family protein n=1 Tax=Knoellia pratensis TaxID=3404796 RepID=UPI003622C601